MGRHKAARLTSEDISQIGMRFSLARMAGEHAVDAGHGWDEATMNAVSRSWNDVPPLVDALQIELARTAPGATGAAVEALDALPGYDTERDFGLALQVLLDAVPAPIAAAYRRAGERQRLPGMWVGS